MQYSFINMLLYATVVFAVLAGVMGVPSFGNRIIDGRIVNGTDAKTGQYPFQISLRFLDIPYCGGSIINENWILTAAHCIYGRKPIDYKVMAGSINVNGSGGIVIPVLKIHMHEGYNYTAPSIHDIALLKLETPLKFSSLIQPVALPNQMEDTPAGTPATVIGWGKPYTGGDAMSTLQSVDIVIYSDEDCVKAHYNPPHPSNICAGVPEGGKGQCSGDSGGPLIANGHQVGIVSWSVKPCTVKGYPGVYTEVAYYIDWINQTIN